MTVVIASCGIEFRLLKNRMSSMHYSKGQPGRRHWAYRKDVKATIEEGCCLPTGGPYLTGKETPQSYWAVSDNQGWPVNRSYRGTISIGCMRFSGKNYKTLRKWALGRS